VIRYTRILDPVHVLSTRGRQGWWDTME
jgi:hypothetical protein